MLHVRLHNLHSEHFYSLVKSCLLRKEIFLIGKKSRATRRLGKATPRCNHFSFLRYTSQVLRVLFQRLGSGALTSGH